MKFFGLMIIVAFVASLACAQEAAKKDGKALYNANKCFTCHPIESAGIKGGKKTDLSSIGKEMKADAIVKYLKKESEIKGKKHSTKFNGTDADMIVLAQWLASLKADVKK